MNVRTGILIALLLSFGARANGGGFSRLPLSARAVTLGGSLISFTDDPNVLFYNPAAIGPMHSLSVSTSYTRLFPGVSDDRLFYVSGSAVANLGFAGNLGIGVKAFSSNSWKENELVGTYAQELFDFLSVGGSAKVLYWSAAAPSGLLAVPEEAISTVTFSFDVGALTTIRNIFPDNDLQVGLFFGDITRPTIAKNGSGDGTLDLRMSLGATYISRVYDYAVTAHYTVAGETRRVGVGAEVSAMKTSILDQPVELMVRAGLGGLQASAHQADLNGGLGLRVADFILDYAYAYQTQLLYIEGTHHLTLRYTF
jgi:hypothetical protein